MKSRLCSADDCKKPFEPLQDYQKYCSPRCASRMRVRNCRARKRFAGDDGGGPGGGKRQPRLFPLSAMHRRKPAKALKSKPKQDHLFDNDGSGIHATFGGAAEYAQDGSLSDNARLNKYSVKSGKRPPVRVASIPEAPLAA